MNIKKQAFTLVELIVVITILAILGTIAFLSLSGYSKDSRNSVRYNDLKLIESSLELYSQKTGFYPESTLPVTITFAQAEAWTQGTFGDNTFGSVGKLDHLPLDPLTGTEYTYSLLNTKSEYQVAAALEGIVATNDSIINKTYAGNLEGTSLVLGTYNGNMLSVSTGGLDYVLAVPTIISGDITLLSVDEILFYNKLAYNGSRVLAGSYENTEFDTNKTFDYGFTSATGGLIVFTGSIDELKTDESKRVALLDNLQKAYNGTVIENDTNYKRLMSETIDISSPTTSTNTLAKTIIENSLNINIKRFIIINQWATGSDASSSYDNPNYYHSQATGEPDVATCGFSHQAWLQGNYGQQDWLELTYDIPVNAKYLRIHETYTDGTIYKVELKDIDGNYHIIWEGIDTTICSEWFELSFERTDYLVDGIKIYVDTIDIDNRVQIDAVELSNDNGTLSLCANKPNYQNAYFAHGNPSVTGTARQNTNSIDACYYDCIDSSYTGNDCNTNISSYMGTVAKGTSRFEFTNGTNPGGTSIVHDKLTGLSWQSNGFASQNGATEDTMNWDDAKAHCSNLSMGGQNDWRLPDYTEYQSIINYNSNLPALDTNYFTAYNDYLGSYWISHIHYYRHTTHAWYINDYYGYVNANTKITKYNVRCVR